MRATVCLPTYNERENLPRMIDALAGVLRDGDRVLVIDERLRIRRGRDDVEVANRLSHPPRRSGERDLDRRGMLA